MKYIALAGALGAILLTSGCAPQGGGEDDVIRVGQISNRTGATSDIGVPLADGARDAWRWINANGGVRGKTVEVVEIETGYDIPRTISAFRRLVDDVGVPLIHGFGTPDSAAVLPLATRSKVVYMPTSYAVEFVDAEHAPYFFITNADYSTAARAAVQYVAEQGGKLALARNPGGFGIAPIADMKKEAEKLGVPIVAEEDIGYTPTDAVQQCLAFINSGATHIWMGNTSAAMSVLARDLARQGSEAILLGNIYAGDEAFLRNAGQDAEGHLALYGSVAYGDEGAEAMKAVMAANYASPDTHYIRGWAQTLIAAEAIGRAIDEGLEITGENLRAMLHTFRDFSPGGLVPPVSYFEDDHRPNMEAPIYQVQDGEWVKVWDSNLER